MGKPHIVESLTSFCPLFTFPHSSRREVWQDALLRVPRIFEMATFEVARTTSPVKAGERGTSMRQMDQQEKRRKRDKKRVLGTIRVRTYSRQPRRRPFWAPSVLLPHGGAAPRVQHVTEKPMMLASHAPGFATHVRGVLTPYAVPGGHGRCNGSDCPLHPYVCRDAMR